MLRGNSPAKIDDRGRLKIPNGFRSLIEDEHGRELFVTSLHGDSVRIYPMPVWIEIEKKIAQAGYKPYATKTVSSQFLETNTQDCFHILIGKAPLPRRTFEGRVQRALRAVPAGGHGQLPERPRLYAHHRVQAPDGPAARRHLHRARIPLRRGRALLPDPEPCQRGPLQALRGAGRGRGGPGPAGAPERAPRSRRGDPGPRHVAQRCSVSGSGHRDLGRR